MHAQGLEAFEDLVRGGRLAGALLRGDRDRLDAPGLHRLSDVTFDERVDHDGEEVQEQESLDAIGALEVYGDDLRGRLELLMPLLDERLVLVDLQEVQWRLRLLREVCDQGEGPVGSG